MKITRKLATLQNENTYSLLFFSNLLFFFNETSLMKCHFFLLNMSTRCRLDSAWCEMIAHVEDKVIALSSGSIGNKLIKWTWSSITLKHLPWLIFVFIRYYHLHFLRVGGSSLFSFFDFLVDAGPSVPCCSNKNDYRNSYHDEVNDETFWFHFFYRFSETHLEYLHSPWLAVECRCIFYCRDIQFS